MNDIAVRNEDELTYPDWCTITREGVIVTGVPTYEEWERLFVHWAGVKETVDWILYDLLAVGEEHYSDRVDQAISLTGLSKKTIQNKTSVAKAFPPTTRIPGATFSHHAEVVSLPPDERRELLEQVVEEQITCEELRHIVRVRQGRDTLPERRPIEVEDYLYRLRDGVVRYIVAVETGQQESSELAYDNLYDLVRNHVERALRNG